MSEHHFFYYPYASFTKRQLPLLKVAALYFDKLFILDPVGASWNTVGADDIARSAVLMLKEAGILEIVTPSMVLSQCNAPMLEAIRRDMADNRFLELCDTHALQQDRQRWTLALSKVPENLHDDQNMRYLLGDFVRDTARMTASVSKDSIGHNNSFSRPTGEHVSPPSGLVERANVYTDYVESGRCYDEERRGYNNEEVEYRYVSLPLALGESIMVNHTLFAGLLDVGATPIADEPFHNQVLALKLRRASQDPDIAQVLADRANTRQIKADLIGFTALTNTDLTLPILNPELPLQEVLEYRLKHNDELAQARNELGELAQLIKVQPWTELFAVEIEDEFIPAVKTKLDEARKVRDAWLKSKRGRLALSAAGIAMGGAAAILSLCTAPLTPVSLATAGLSFGSSTIIPGLQWLQDFKEGKKNMQENGLHYLLKI